MFSDQHSKQRHFFYFVVKKIDNMLLIFELVLPLLSCSHFMSAVTSKIVPEHLTRVFLLKTISFVLLLYFSIVVNVFFS